MLTYLKWVFERYFIGLYFSGNATNEQALFFNFNELSEDLFVYLYFVWYLMCYFPYFMTFLSSYSFVPLLFLLSGSPLDSDNFCFLVIRRLVLCVVFVFYCLLFVCTVCLEINK